jgi:hypothetical protein
VKVLLRLGVVAGGVVCALVAAEATLRWIDRQGPVASASSPSPSELAHRYVSGIPVADGVRREWFDISPAPLDRRPLPPDLAQVAEQIKALTVSSEMFKQWNSRFIQERVCGGDSFFQRFPGFAFSYDPDLPSTHPPYRYLYDITSPYGLVTNKFGFRGHAIDADKPAGVIRIAAVGASTTVGAHLQAFSYPEFLEPWLNRWAQHYAPGVRFEVINAGREGIISTDIAAIVKQEVMPLEPDVVVYHEGANQFSFRNLIEEAGEPIVVPAELSPAAKVPGVDRFALMRRLDVAVRRFGLGSGAEPRKPRYTLRWPSPVDEVHPNPDAPALPLDLPRVVRDLDDMRGAAQTGGARLVLTSFIWMVHDGLVVDPVNDAYFFRTLNLRHWPARYSDIRRMADFQNRVFRAYADARHIPFVDMATPFPRDMAFFGDPIHMTIDGDRLRAWIEFQGLVPILREAIDAHQLPRPDSAAFHAPPAPPLRRDQLVCTDFSSYRRVDAAIPVAALHSSDPGATVTGDQTKRVATSTSRYGYAAEAPIAEAARVSGRGVLYVRFQVVSGSVSIGVLKKDRSGFLQYGTYAAAPGPVEIRLPVPSMSDAGFLMITNAVRADGERSIVDVEDAGVLLPR